MKRLRLLAIAAAMAASFSSAAETIGSVDTAFKLIGPDHKILVDAFDDPKVDGVTCFVSHSKKGGISGALGIAEERSEASVACRQIGAVAFKSPIPKQEEVFSQSASILFKKMRIMRIADHKRNALVYLVYSDTLIDGSPKNSISAVPIPAGVKIPLK